MRERIDFSRFMYKSLDPLAINPSESKRILHFRLPYSYCCHTETTTTRRRLRRRSNSRSFPGALETQEVQLVPGKVNFLFLSLRSKQGLGSPPVVSCRKVSPSPPPALFLSLIFLPLRMLRRTLKVLFTHNLDELWTPYFLVYSSPPKTLLSPRHILNSISMLAGWVG